MALSFQFRSVAGAGPRVALFPGAWNPPTVAHAAMARAALDWASEVVFVLPRAFPHKSFEGASLEERRELLITLARSQPGFSVAHSEGGLYLEIGDEAREFYGPGAEIALICGRDAAERIANWDYGRPGVFAEMLRRYRLLVAGRAGDYDPDPEHSSHVLPLDAGGPFDEVSSTEVRRRIASGELWRHLVPEPLAPSIALTYRARKHLD